MNNIEICSGITTGILSCIIFNPIDKMIYVSTTKNISILNKELWKDLYKGSSISIATRLITSGLYFSYIDYYEMKIENKLNLAILTSLICSITNPLQLLKFNSWYNNYSIKESYLLLKTTHGIRAPFIGITALIIRDVLFNYLYLTYKQRDNHFNNLMVICGSIVIISPINLIKNKKYALNENLKSIIKNFRFSQLGISFGVLRMGLGFYVSQFIYDINKICLNNKK
jgi:hypothetical protein